jgi:antitoxin component YwqK of YwqJK toxin-antitoxin module
MPKKRGNAEPHVHYHKDGTIWAKGQMIDGVMAGYWEWFRKDGTIMRSGSFENGEQAGEWTTYDKNGRVVKVTTMKPKTNAAARPVAKRPTAKKARVAKKK